jgi:Zn-dependent protease
MGFVAAAGPAANLAMGLGWMALLVLMINLGVTERFPIEMCKAGVIANSVMCAFNLIPIPPLDGGRIMTALLPRDLAYKFASIERLGPIIFLGLILLLNTGPFRSLVGDLVGLVMTLIELPFRPFLPYVS